MNTAINTGVIKQRESHSSARMISNPGINLAFSLLFAALMAISANSFIYLPFTPVPITTQVLTVLLSGLFLGSRWASVSQIIYIFIGVMGFPVFSGFKNGIVALGGPTGGYIMGFIVAAFISGYIYENSEKVSGNAAGNLIACFISCVAGVMIIHLFGFIHLAGYIHNAAGSGSIFDIITKTWKLGTEPFLLIDFFKIIFALIIINLKYKK